MLRKWYDSEILFLMFNQCSSPNANNCADPFLYFPFSFFSFFHFFLFLCVCLLCLFVFVCMFVCMYITKITLWTYRGILYTVKFRLTTAPIIRPSTNYDDFFLVPMVPLYKSTVVGPDNATVPLLRITTTFSSPNDH